MENKIINLGEGLAKKHELTDHEANILEYIKAWYNRKMAQVLNKDIKGDTESDQS